jgi:hypothetical protein
VAIEHDTGTVSATSAAALAEEGPPPVAYRRGSSPFRRRPAEPLLHRLVPVRNRLMTEGLAEDISDDHFFPTVRAAIAHCSPPTDPRPAGATS